MLFMHQNMIAQDRSFTDVKGEWHAKFLLRESKLFLETVSDLTMEHYEAQMDQQMVLADKNFEIFFGNTSNLFQFLEASFSELTIVPGKISFQVKTPIGKIQKKFELSIQTHRKEVDQALLRQMKLRKLQTELESLKEENHQIKQKMKESEASMQKLTQVFKKFQITLQQKDEVINSIFVELKQIRQWKEEKEHEEMSKMKRKFRADASNPHNLKFIQVGSRFKKSGGGSWQVLMCKNQIQKNDIFRYTIRQIKAGTGGSFMYGIGSPNIKGIIRAQDHKEFIGYYENTGNIYDRGESRKGGPRIKDGDIIGVQVNTRQWTIGWTIQGIKQAQIPIHGELRLKPIFLSIVVYNDDAEIQFM